MTRIPRSNLPLNLSLLPWGQLVRTADTARTATASMALMMLPHGGQRLARKNAWASMSECSARARGRREADTAMDQAVAIARHPTAHAR